MSGNLTDKVTQFAGLSKEGQRKLKKKKAQLVSEALMLSMDGIPAAGDKFRIFTKNGEKVAYFGYINNGDYFFFDYKDDAIRSAKNGYRNAGTCYTKFVKADD